MKQGTTNLWVFVYKIYAVNYIKFIRTARVVVAPTPTDEKSHFQIAFPSGEGGGVCRRMRRDRMSVILGFVWDLIYTNIFLLIHRNRENKFSLRSPFPAREG